MNRFARLLDEPEQKINKIISKLEDLSGNNSEDVRLISEYRNILHKKIRSLGLDPADTHPEELYEMLKIKLSSDFMKVSKAWSLEGIESSHHIAEIMEQSLDADPVLSIKCSSFKKLLRVNQPKKTMKLLGYRSLESMLKHEDTRTLVAISHMNEPSKWNDKLASSIAKLSSVDYEMRPIKILVINQELENSKKLNMPIVSIAPLMAAVVLNSGDPDSKTNVYAVLLALQAEEMMRYQSQYLSANQFSPNFSEFARRLYSQFEPLAISIENQPFMPTNQAFKFMPVHKNKNAYDKFTLLHPALYWWQGTAHLAQEADKSVSLHISDVFSSISKRLPYLEHYHHNYAQELKGELFKRYLNYSSVKDYLSDQIDGTLIALEELVNPGVAQVELEEAYL